MICSQAKHIVRWLIWYRNCIYGDRRTRKRDDR